MKILKDKIEIDINLSIIDKLNKIPNKEFKFLIILETNKKIKDIFLLQKTVDFCIVLCINLSCQILNIKFSVIIYVEGIGETGEAKRGRAFCVVVVVVKL